MLIHGDCLEVMTQIPDHSVDMILCDLPYGTTRNKWDSVIPLDNLWKEYNRVCHDNTPICLFAQSPFNKVLACSNLKIFRYEWIWEKTSATGHLNSKRAPMKAHENILLFYKKQPMYNPQKTKGHPRKISTAIHKRNSKITTNWGKYDLTSYDSTERFPRDVITFPTDKQTLSLHPTQKPVDLLRYLIRTYIKENDIILDNAMGSGSTIIAALQEHRSYIGIEKDEEYFNLASERIEKEIRGQTNE